jgi:hexosaminidase
MIDTARHFEPLDSIKRIIDSLPYAKLNVLHWHMSDSQSFPLQFHAYPKLWNGAWSAQERYLQTDVADVVEYARLRGVRVFPEFDVPGHAASWCAGYPEICPSVSCTQPLNVANNKTFDVIDAIVKEMTGGSASKPGQPSVGVFKDNFFHLGGDEVDTSCWSKTPAIAAWLAAQGMSADDGYAYFAKRAAEIAIKYEHRPIQWSEVYDHFKTKLDKRTVVHIWKSNTNVTEVVANGYQVLLNVGYCGDSWYLDNLATKWDAVYSNEPCKGVPDALCPMIIGGHGEMWGETVDASDIEQTVWPRLGAIAERLWSPRALTNSANALPRIEAFRCHLNKRGIAAAPVTNKDARASPSGPGSCYRQ